MKRKHRIRGKKLATVAVTLLVTVSLTGCASENKENELLYRQTGIDYMENGNYADAVAAFDSALSYCMGTIGETELDICYYKAAAQYASGDLEGAMATYNALIAYDDKDADAYYTRGCLLLQTGETNQALDDFSKAVTYHPNDYELYIQIYKNLAAYNMTEQGTEYLNQAFSIEGDDVENLTYRGELYLLLGEYANAKEELESALVKNSVRANLVMAQLFEVQGDMENAETYYKAYAESTEADAEAMNALARIAMAKADYVTALSYVNQGLAMETTAGRRELLQNKVICMEYTADFTGAWQTAQEYVAMYPNDLDMQREYIFLKNRQQSVEAELAIQAEVETGVPEATEAAEQGDSTETTE